MKSSKLKKLCAVIMAATISTTLFIGCGSSNDGSTSSKGNSNASDTVKQELVFNL